VSTGAFDILLTLPGYHLAQTGVGYLFDAIKGDIEERRQSALIDWADDYYNRRFGLRILTLHSVPGSHFVLREPLRQSKPLDGLKVRTTPTFSEIVRLLGGSPVNISPAEAYSAMQTGELDGIALPAFASAEYKLYEVGKFMTRPLFGLGNVMLMMNAAKLASLPPKLRHVMVEEGSRFDQIGKDAFDRLAAQDQEIMLKNGVKTVNLEAAFALKINELYNEVIFHNANRASPHEVKTLWDLAKGRNLLNQ
jgi:TRAP-type transport system periplasmic protein